MIVCAECGAQNEEGAAFCGDCGAFLEWAGAADDEQLPATEQAAEPGTDPSAEPTGAPEPEPAVTATITEDDSRVPGAVRPAEEVRRRRRRPPPGPPRPPAEGELGCPSCRAGNDRARKFCRSCGAELHPPRPPVRKGWWRRWRDRRARRRIQTAGTRRKERRRLRVPRRLIALGLAAALAALAAGPFREPVTNAYAQADTAVRDRISTPAPITPTGWEASSSRRGAGPDHLSTRVTDEFWAPDGDPAGSWVEAELPRPVRLLHVLIHAGQSTDPELFQQQARPHEVEVLAFAADGASVSVDLVVLDRPGEQRFAVRASDVVRVRFVFHSAHDMSQGRFMAVGEIELFARE